jgi:hypothetical protein
MSDKLIMVKCVYLCVRANAALAVVVAVGGGECHSVDVVYSDSGSIQRRVACPLMPIDLEWDPFTQSSLQSHKDICTLDRIAIHIPYNI